ncbi:MAG TPA: TIGR03086 family metal-binding protein [Acidimicrobiales bacterium]|nr:TIGR03086 family metal-binding protein [Acidimicrobiales bacterium]
MDNVALMKQVIASTDKVVKGTEPSQLGLPSPCTEWTVRDVINHITGGSTMFAVCVEEGSVPDDLLGKLMAGDNLGDDYVGAWEAASSRAIAAFEAPGALDKMVKLPFGEMPAGVALNIAVFDVLTHAADIANATGQTIDDTALVETALEVGHQMIGPELRVPGVFDPEQSAPEGAPPTVRLLAFAGRKV